RSTTFAAAPHTRRTWWTCSFGGDWPGPSRRPGPAGPTEMGGLLQITGGGDGSQRAPGTPPPPLLGPLLRGTPRLNGAHLRCDSSNCGACTVLLDGVPVKSCTMFAVQADGRAVTTVEGLQSAAGLDPIQEAFKEEHGLQCGYCTPGMMLVGKALLAENPSPSDDEVRWAISGNICRCTGYMNILKAVQAAGPN